MCFYSYDSTGKVIRCKVIQIEEGTRENHNLSIFPFSDDHDQAIARTGPVSEAEIIENSDIEHAHHTQWNMFVNMWYFYIHDNVTEEKVGSYFEFVGAHEMGHVLGLTDVDNECTMANGFPHHNDLLMGYDSPLCERGCDITYKDIAGVAITRGFHTDADHKWLYCGVQQDGTHKLLCSICNGVRYVDSLSGYTYNLYECCGGNHSLSGGNMMAVASYGTDDYYKCKYCRYVAPFSALVAQNYSSAISLNNDYHTYTNTVTGLNYTVKEAHQYVNGVCSVCGHAHTHSFSPFKYYSHTSHRRQCACGIAETEPHVIRQSDIMNGRYAICLGCNRRLDLYNDFADMIMVLQYFVTANGSFILPNGIVILADEDVDAYWNGTLQFYRYGDAPVTDS